MLKTHWGFKWEQHVDTIPFNVTDLKYSMGQHEVTTRSTKRRTQSQVVDLLERCTTLKSPLIPRRLRKRLQFRWSDPSHIPDDAIVLLYVGTLDDTALDQVLTSIDAD